MIIFNLDFDKSLLFDVKREDGMGSTGLGVHLGAGRSPRQRACTQTFQGIVNGGDWSHRYADYVDPAASILVDFNARFGL